jgi:type IV pilus assembly protein PilQ
MKRRLGLVVVVVLAALGTLWAQAPVAPLAASQSSAAPSAQKRYTGEPNDYDFGGADLRTVLRSFAELHNLNLVIDGAIKGTVDIKLTAVPWDQALEIILKASNLGYQIDGTVVRIAPLSVLTSEEQDRKKLADAQALAGTPEVRTYALSYSKAAELEPLLKQAALSSRGQIQKDERTNTLVISDLPAYLTKAESLIATLDREEPQVEIEAQIVQANRSEARALGIQWGFGGRMAQDLGNTTGAAFPNSIGVGGKTSNTPTPPAGTVVNMPVTGATAGMGLSLGAITGAFSLDATLSALETRGKVHILSKPRVTTQNNHEAEMTQGFEIPIQVVSNNTVTVQYKDAALKLTVTPQITSNTVTMKILLENGTPDFTKAVNGNPSINTQRAYTQVKVADGVTTVIGGIISKNETNNSDRTPGLSSIPLLGWLFRRDTSTTDSQELLIFITPRILRSRP